MLNGARNISDVCVGAGEGLCRAEVAGARGDRTPCSKRRPAAVPRRGREVPDAFVAGRRRRYSLAVVYSDREYDKGLTYIKAIARC